MLIGALFLVLNSAQVQTKLARWAAADMSKRLGSKVQIDKLDIDFLNRITLDGFLVFDQSDDTLFYTNRVNLTIRRFSLRNNKFRFGELLLDKAEVHLVATDTTGGSNIDFITDYFSPAEQEVIEDSLKTSSDLYLSAGNIILNECLLTFENPFREEVTTITDFNHLKISEIDGNIADFVLDGDTLKAHIKHLSFYEESGLELQNLNALLTIDQNRISTENLEMITPGSNLSGDLALLHESWSDYGNFISKVKLDADFENSKINLSDIGYFSSSLSKVDFPVALDGKISGTIDNLKGRNMKLAGAERTVIRGNFDITGLPDAENAFIDLRIKQLSSDYDDIARIGREITGDLNFESRLPLEFKRSGSAFFEGSFTGFPQDFVAYGSLTTEAGFLDLDLNLVNDSLNNRLVYKGGLASKNLNLGRILALPELGTVTANTEILAYSKGELVSATVNGTVENLVFQNYNYKNLKIDGELAKKRFGGELTSRDPNFNLDFSGVVDLSGNTPVFNFFADVYNLDLTALNLVEMPSRLSFSSKLDLTAEGKTLNDINGTLVALDSYLCYGDSVVFMDELKFTALGSVENRKISFTSDIVDVSVTGAFDIEELPASFANLIGGVLPSLMVQKPLVVAEDFQFSINNKAENYVTHMFVPSLEIAPGSTAYGSYNSSSRSFELFLKSGKISYQGVSINDLTVDLGKISEVLKAKVYADKVDAYGVDLQNFDLDLEAYNDIVQVGLGWLNKDGSHQGDLMTQVNFVDSSRVRIELKPGKIGNATSLWEIEKPAVLWIDSNHIAVEGLELESGAQRLELKGSISKNPEEELKLILRNFDLATLDSLGIKLEKPIQGTVNLNASVKDFYQDRILTAQGGVNNISYGNYFVGNVNLESRYFGEEKKLFLKGGLSRGSDKVVDFEGTYKIGAEMPLDGRLSLDDFNLALINAFDIPEINDYSGYANGEIFVRGDLSKPALDGYIDFDDARFKVEYLNTYYTFSDRLRVEEGWLGIDYKPIYDQQGNKGFVVASAFHDNYSNWTYDIDVEANNFFFLNTTRELNNTYYGTAYATGEVQIGGYEGFLEINIDATTNKGTSVKLPLDQSEEVTLENFVYFVNTSADSAKNREVDLSGVQMRLNIDATPDAEVQLIFDERAGDIIKGRGSGKLTLEIAPSGEFRMFGRYEVQEGSYLFTLKNLINKQFDVRQGGTIGWYGDPYQADIDLSAAYRLRTPLMPIIVENPERYRGREDVNVVLNLNGKLLNPNISFDVELPQATETERSQLASVVSTTQQLNQQVFALLILNRFLPVSQNQQTQGVTGVSGLGSATTSDFISTQISNWLSEISNEFDIGLNYRPGDEISNQEIAVALSTQLFNERLAVSGSFGVTSASENQYTQGQTGILGDFLVEYMLTEDGKIRLMVFNETNPYEVFSTTTSIYTQGVGLIYQEDFDTLDEFFEEVKGLFSKDKATKVN